MLKFNKLHNNNNKIQLINYNSLNNLNNSNIRTSINNRKIFNKVHKDFQYKNHILLSKDKHNLHKQIGDMVVLHKILYKLNHLQIQPPKAKFRHFYHKQVKPCLFNNKAFNLYNKELILANNSKLEWILDQIIK